MKKAQKVLAIPLTKCKLCCMILTEKEHIFFLDLEA